MTLENIHYENIENRISINVIHNNEATYCLWLEKGSAILEFQLNNKDQKLEKISGRIGEVIKNANLSESEQVARCVEALENGLWDYYHPSNNMSKKIGLK